jgi:cytochrome c biogenesis protein CcmG/thiol:disulfide interchange protein DsbE
MTSENLTTNEEQIQPKTRPQWGRIFVWGVLAVLLAIVGLALLRNQQGPVQIGKPAPDFSLTTFEGEPISLESLSGKVVLLNFWASWCKPCEQEAADLEEAWRFYKPRGDVAFVGIDWTDTEPNAMEYLAKFDITYPNGPDLGTRISQAYRTTGVPETYIIDKQGNLRYIKISPFLSLQEIFNVIDPLLTNP